MQCAALTINFVRVAEGRVTGTLAPYADPETGVQLFTAFDGLLRGNVIEGETLDQLFPSRATVGMANAGAGEAGSPRCSRARFSASSMLPWTFCSPSSS